MSEDLIRLMTQPPPTSVREMRALIEATSDLLNAGAPEVGAFHEGVPIRTVDGAPIRADVAVPKGAGPHPVLVFLHGGGWVCGSPATHRKLALRFAEAGYLVFNLDYRLSPEHRFPAAFEDCVHAIRWAAAQAPRFGGDASRLAVGGDSAGGNLTAAAVAALAREADAPRISAALLIYGVFDFAAFGEIGADASATGQRMARGVLSMVTGAYLGDSPPAELLADPRLSPIHAAAQLPPCHMVAGTADPLLPQQEALAKRLAELGTPHESVVVPGMPHAFVQMEMFPQARQAIDGMVAFLRRHV
jgi:acetyl esterase/lipase